MKKKSFLRRTAAILAAAVVGCTSAGAGMEARAWTAEAATGSYTVEQLDRGIAAFGTGSGMLVSWRVLANDPEGAVYRLYRDDRLIYTSQSGQGTCFLDSEGQSSSVYRVDTLAGGTVTGSDTCTLKSKTGYLDIPLLQPGSNYSPNDCSCGDVDGDGQYELILKWDPSNSQDNSKSGYTDNVYIDCYRLTGERLWRIDLGKNIRAGQHYTQFLVADFDLDGKAEMTCKTADGTVDGTGKVIGNASADYRNSGGYVLKGPEYYTLFDGETGRALDTVDYPYPRGDVNKWGDKYGNRVDRFLGAVCYLDGVHPSAVTVRGYYTRMTAAAFDVRGKKLVRRWGFDTGNNSSANGYGNGNHNAMPADVDGDGKQELVLGGTCLDDDGTVLWCTGKGHGDAMHVGDLDPDRPGLEAFVCHEAAPYGISLLDAKNGSVIWHRDGSKDTGRCCADHITADVKGSLYWGLGYDVVNSAGKTVASNRPSINFLIHWDGDLERELLDGNTITKYSVKGGAAAVFTADGCESNNGTKAVPCLTADLFGDWREELVLRTSDNRHLRIFATPESTQYRMTTLMQDPQYRMQVAAEQSGYNQPAHQSFYLGSDRALPERTPVSTPKVTPIPIPTANPAPPDADGYREGAKMDTAKAYMIRNVNSGRYMEVENGEEKPGANVDQWGGDPSAPQQHQVWYLREVNWGYYYIYSALGDGKTYLLDCANENNGTNINIAKKNGYSNQYFKFVDNHNGTYEIVTRASREKSCVEIGNARITAGGNVQQYQWNDHDCQKWELIPVNYGKHKVRYADLDLGDESLSRGSLIHGRASQEKTETSVPVSGSVFAIDQNYTEGVEETTNAGFTGRAYLNLENKAGSLVEWRIRVPEEGNYLCTFRHANGTTVDRKMKVRVNGGTDVWMQSFSGTGSWTMWKERSIVLPLRKGINAVAMTSVTADGGPNFDFMNYELTDEPVPEPYAEPSPVPTEKPDPAKSRTIWIAGDSTVQTYSSRYAPQQGWGAHLADFIPSGNRVNNHAMAGRSSKSFVEEGRLQTILNQIQTGDYLLVQFGINDSASTKTERYAPPCGTIPGTAGSYEYYMEQFIKGALDRGAKPVIVTTVIGLKATTNGVFRGTYGRWCDACRRLAEYYRIPLVDLNTLSANLYNQVGYNEAYTYHMISTGNGNTDQTHFTEKGAKAIAKLVADDLKRQGLV